MDGYLWTLLLANILQLNKYIFATKLIIFISLKKDAWIYTKLMLHHTPCDQLPTNPMYYELHQEWIISAEDHEKALAKRNEEILTRYNKMVKPLPELSIGIRYQYINHSKKTTSRWIKTGEIISKLPNRQ